MKYEDMPLCSSPLNADEAIRLQQRLDLLLQFLRTPGDWGYKTKLGHLTQQLHGLKADVEKALDQAVNGG